MTRQIGNNVPVSRAGTREERTSPPTFERTKESFAVFLFGGRHGSVALVITGLVRPGQEMSGSFSCTKAPKQGGGLDAWLETDIIRLPQLVAWKS